MKKIYKILIIVIIILLLVLGWYYYKKSKEHYADQVMHWYAGNIAGPILDPRTIYGDAYDAQQDDVILPPEKVKFMERESY